MGLARVGGMCTNQHNCVIGELGVTNSMGKPYPSAGFTAVFVMAHEVGHNLGMYHDDTVSRGAIKIHNFSSWVHRLPSFILLFSTFIMVALNDNTHSFQQNCFNISCRLDVLRTDILCHHPEVLKENQNGLGAVFNP